MSAVEGSSTLNVVEPPDETSSDLNTINNDDDDTNAGEKKNPLCGYLKTFPSLRLPVLKKWKWYWFVYTENTCKLCYFRDAHSTTPSGEISIANATFFLKIDENCLGGGTFRIRHLKSPEEGPSTPEHDFDLEAKDRVTALYWLQELQKRRRRFSRRKTAHIQRHGVSSISHLGKSTGGLLKEQCSIDSLPEDDNIPPLVSPVSPPEGSIGEEADRPPDTNTLSSSWSFSNLRTQICNGITGIRNSKTGSECGMTLDRGILSTNMGPTFLENPDISRQDEQLMRLRTSKARKSFRNSLPFSTQTDDCKRCSKLQLEIVEMQKCFASLNLELKTANETVLFLQKQLDLACRQKESVMKIHSEPNVACHMQLSINKDVELAQMAERLQQLNRYLEDVKLEYRVLRREGRDLHCYNQEMLQLKNQIISQLTEQVNNLELERANWRSQGTVQHRENRVTFVPAPGEEDPLISSPSQTENIYSDIDKIRDELQAYRLQNSFLNSEILQLNLLRNDSEERESYIKMKCLEWEAKYYAIQSKYMVLLNEYHSPRNGSGIISSASPDPSASQLLHEAIQDNSSPDYLSIAKVISSDSRYDIYGFTKTSASPAYSLIKGAYLLRQRSDEIVGTIRDSDIETWISKWDNYVASLSKRSLQPSPSLKEMIRNGIPFFHRSTIWKGCVELQVKQLRDSKPKNYYEQLLESVKYGAVTDITSKQIELDLLRTLPHNKHFANAHSGGIPKLRRVLLAYSRHNTSVGYCQGLNRLTAIALLFMSEEEAFWTLVAIIEFLMPPDYYSRDLLGAQVDQLVLKDLVFEKVPRLHSHMEVNKVDVSMITFNWFMCVFVDCVPIETYLSIWDSFLFEGSKVLFRFALAMLRIAEEECLKTDDQIAINKILQTSSETLTDFKRLSQIAFNDLNPFPRRAIVHKREQYSSVVRAEIDKINERRSAYRTLSHQSSTRSVKTFRRQVHT